MQAYPDFSTAIPELDLFVRENWDKLPARVKEEIQRHDGPGVSPVDRLVKITEAMYAFHKQTGSGLNTIAGRTLIGRLARFANLSGFQSLRDERGAGIVAAMSREVGEPAPDGGHPAPATDPDPLPEMVEPEPEA